VARPRNQALARRDVQILHRSLTGRQGHRHRRVSPGFPENAIVLPAARTGTSGPACRNNTSSPQRTAFPNYADQLDESTLTDHHLHACGRSNPVRGVGDGSAGLRDVRTDGPTKTCSRCGQTKRMRTTPRSA